MKNVTVSEEALRELVREALDNKEVGSVIVPEGCAEEPVNVNNVVDPSAALTDPGNEDYRPQDRVELQVAVKALSDDLPAEKVPDVYEKFAGALKIAKDKDEKDGEKKMSNEKETKVEALVRAAVRKHLSEAGPPGKKFPPRKIPAGPIVGDLPPVKKIPAGVHGKEFMDRFNKGKKDLKALLKHDLDADVEGGEGDAEEKRKFSTMTDVQGKSFQDIAKELGFSVAGAKQAVDKALQKAQWVAKVDQQSPDDLEILVLTSMNDYIKFLSKSGELSAADVQLMKDHPDIVRELDGFREFLDKAVRKARKGGTLEDPLGEALVHNNGQESRKVIKKGRLTVVLEKAGDFGMTKKCKFCKQDVATSKTAAGEYLDKHEGPDGSDCHGSRSRVSAAVTTEGKKSKPKCPECDGTYCIDGNKPGTMLCHDCGNEFKWTQKKMKESKSTEPRVCKCGGERFRKEPDGSQTCLDCKRNVVDESKKPNKNSKKL